MLQTIIYGKDKKCCRHHQKNLVSKKHNHSHCVSPVLVNRNRHLLGRGTKIERGYTNFLLKLAIGICISYALLIRYVDNTDQQWVVFVTTLYVLLTVAYINLFVRIPYEELDNKVLAVIIMGISVWSLSDHMLQILFEDTFIVPWIREISLCFSLAIFPPLFLYSIFRSFQARSDEYNIDGCFLAYRYPKNFIGLLAVLFNKEPFGSCCLVIKGRRLAFKDWYVRETEHANQSRYIYTRIDDIDMETARTKLVNKKWSPINNCFVVFHKYVRKCNTDGRRNWQGNSKGAE